MTTLAVTLTVLSLVILASFIGGAIFLLKKYSSTRGDYYTQVLCFKSWAFMMMEYIQEDEGDKLAGDADTAVLKAKTGSQVKMRREWFI